MKAENKLVEQHRAAGRMFEAGGIRGFVREAGKGEAVVCMHGVPSSSFLYRKMLPELAKRGFRGIAFDLPGLGFSDRPEDFDYSWSGLGKWSTQATEALGLEKFHLLIHDLGGPVGLEMLAAHPERIASLTILNTLVANVASFSKPWVMRPFEWKGIGELFLKSLIPAAFRILMHKQGVQNRAEFGIEEARAYVQLLKQQDGGKAFLKIMRSFETTPEKEQLYLQAVKGVQIPKQIIWGENDPALRLEKFGYSIRDQMEIDRLFITQGKHFLQEDHAPEIAARIEEMIRPDASSSASS